MPATVDSSIYKQAFYGILNRDGGFWTTLAFESEDDARTHLEKFVNINPERFGTMLRTHKIVPVRIQLTQIEPA